MNEQTVTVTFNPASIQPRVTFNTDQEIKFGITPEQRGTVIFNVQPLTPDGTAHVVMAPGERTADLPVRFVELPP